MSISSIVATHRLPAKKSGLPSRYFPAVRQIHIFCFSKSDPFWVSAVTLVFVVHRKRAPVDSTVNLRLCVIMVDRSSDGHSSSTRDCRIAGGHAVTVVPFTGWQGPLNQRGRHGRGVGRWANRRLAQAAF